MNKTLLYSLLLVSGIGVAGSYAVAQDSESEANETFEISGFKPGNGEAVKSISTVTISVPMMDIYIDEEKIGNITVTNGEVTAKAEGTGGIRPNDDETLIECEIEFDATLDTPGVYTLTVPAGIIKDNETGSVNKEASTTIVVDPSVKAGMDLYFFNPEDGSSVNNISKIKIGFPSFSYNDMITVNDECVEPAVISNGTTSYKCEIAPDWSWSGEGMGFDITVSGSESKITEEGKWTLTIPAGAFIHVDELSPAITAEYTVDSSVAKYKWTVPSEYTMNMPTGRMATVMFECEGAESVDYTPANPDAKITVSYGKEEIARVENASTEAGYSLADNYKEPYAEFRINSELMKYGAVLSITADEGAFTIDGEASPKLSYMVSVLNNIPYTATPANKSVQDMPAATAENVEISFAFADDFDDPLDVSAEEFAMPGQIPGIRISYCGESVALADVEKSAADGKFVLSIKRDVFDKEGILAVEGDEGAFTVNGKASPAIVYSCTFGEIKEYKSVITPAPGTEVNLEDLINITISFPDAETAEFDSENQYFVLSLPGAGYPGDPVVTKVEDAECPTFNINFDRVLEIAAPVGGAASLRIGEGTFVLDGKNSSPEIKTVWDVKRTVEIDTSWVPSPNDGYDIVNSGYGIYAALVFNEFESLRMTSDFYDKVVVKFNDEVLPRGEYETSISEGFKLLISLYTDRFCDKSVEGTMSVEIPEGCLTVSGETVPAISYTWKVVSAKDYTYKLTPAAEGTVNSLDEIILEFPNAEKGELYQMAWITLRSSDYSTFPLIKASEVTAVEGAEHPTFRIKFENGPQADGQYVFSVSANTFTLDGSQGSPDIRVDYTLSDYSGVEGITPDSDGNVTVYSIDGRLVMKDMPAESLKNLKRGIYVVNGKKYIIK